MRRLYLLYISAQAAAVILCACGGDPSTGVFQSPLAVANDRIQAQDPVSVAASAEVAVPAGESGIVITAQPQSVEVEEGQSASFEVTASGAPPLRYQWRIGTKDIAGATGPSLRTEPLSLTDSGAVYSVIVANGAARVTSASAKVTVTERIVVAWAPRILSQPRDQSVVEGQVAMFLVGVRSSGPARFQWYRDRTPIPQANAMSYTTPPSVMADHGSRYSVVVSAGSASTTSAEARLSVTPIASAATTFDRDGASMRHQADAFNNQSR